MSFLPPGDVKLGFWTDWSRGQVLGSTITTTTNSANILVAFFAVVVSLASMHLWHLLLFITHQIRANKDVGDGLYRQQQALIRTGSSPERLLIDFAKLGWIWHGKARSFRTFWPAAVAFIFSIIALAVSISSSFIITTSSIKILVDSDNCGYFSASQALKPYAQEFTTTVDKDSLDYARSCYLSDTKSDACVRYVQQKINFTTTAASCPFSESMCIGTGENAAVSMDTLYMDSNDDFGINAKPGDRVKVRKKTTCAPIKVDGYYTTADLDGHKGDFYRAPLPQEQLFQFEYGLNPGYQGTFLSKLGYSTYVSNVTGTYAILSAWSGPSYGNIFANYIPIPELTRKDADTIINFVFPNDVQSRFPIDDPVFAAHKKGYYLVVGYGKPQNFTVYRADNPAGVIACAEQYQYCIPSGDGHNCTELGGLPTRAAQKALGANENHLATFNLFWNSMLNNDISLAGDSANPLLASASVAAGVQQYLPGDQWKLEVNYWESYVLSTIQALLTGHAIGPGVKYHNGSEVRFNPPSTAAGERLCKAQKMMVNGSFANISVFGLAFTVAISGVLILIDLFMLRAFKFFSRFRKDWTPKIERWMQDGVLQLQRKAYEGMGEGQWSRRDEEVPVADKDDLLPDFLREYPQPSRSNTIGSLNTKFAPAFRQASSPAKKSDVEEKMQSVGPSTPSEAADEGVYATSDGNYADGAAVPTDRDVRSRDSCSLSSVN